MKSALSWLTNFERKTTAMLLVAGFAMVTALAGTFTLAPLDRDEARFAQATVQMLESGDFVRIRFQDAERNKKPAGIHWLQAASVSVFSDVQARAIWAYRIPSMAGIVAAAIFTFLAGARLYDVKTGMLAGMFLASAPLVAAEATIAKTDGVLLALICLAQLAFLHVYGAVREGRNPSRRASAGFWIAQGAGMLMKGPIAPMVSLLTGLGLTSTAPRLSWIASLRPVVGILIFMLMVLPWGAAIWSATDGRFFTESVGGDMLGKLGEAQEGHVGPPGYHAFLVWALFWPASALIAPGIIAAWRDRADWRALFLLSWLIPAWLLFEATATKLPHYVMPLYPALAILAARAATGSAPPFWAHKLGAAVYAGVGFLAAALIVIPSLALNNTLPGLFLLAAAAGIAALTILIATLFWRGQGYAGGLAAAVLSCTFAWVIMTGVLPGLSQLAISPRLSAMLELKGQHPLRDGVQPVALVGYSEPSAVFLLGTQTSLTTAEAAATQLRDGAISAAIIEAEATDRFLNTLQGTAVASLAEIDGLNYSNGKPVALQVYVLAP
ncbi:MAG: glycosyltransferase family 39 protein [Pseudomonadota bacterium]